MTADIPLWYTVALVASFSLAVACWAALLFWAVAWLARRGRP